MVKIISVLIIFSLLGCGGGGGGSSSTQPDTSSTKTTCEYTSSLPIEVSNISKSPSGTGYTSGPTGCSTYTIQVTSFSSSVGSIAPGGSFTVTYSVSTNSTSYNSTVYLSTNNSY